MNLDSRSTWAQMRIFTAKTDGPNRRGLYAIVAGAYAAIDGEGYGAFLHSSSNSSSSCFTARLNHSSTDPAACSGPNQLL